jgi:hypothetical protein
MTRKPLLLLALVIAAAALAGAALSVAQTPTSITLKVKGKHVTRHARFCHKSKRLRVFRRGTTLEYRGFVTPAPPKHFPVLVQVDACIHGRFVRVARYHFQGKRATGKYKGFFRAPRPHGRVTYFSARTVVAGVRSNKRYFGVRR